MLRKTVKRGREKNRGKEEVGELYLILKTSHIRERKKKKTMEEEIEKMKTHVHERECYHGKLIECSSTIALFHY